MATYNLSPIGNEDQQFFGAAGANFPPNLPLNGGFLNTFQAGTSTPIATYANNLGSIQNSTTMQLGTDGRFAGAVWLLAGQAYKFQLTDSTGFQIWIIDNVLGINDVSSTTVEWTASNAVPTFSSATTFTTPGNTTATFQVGRRIKATVTAGQVYGTIFSSTFGVSTTVILTMDTGMALDSGLNLVQVGILGESNPSVPQIIPYNTIAFHAHRNAATQTTGTTVLFDTVDNQSGGTNYATGTGLFTAPFTGWYAFSSSIEYANATGGTVAVAITLTVNSVNVAASNRADLVTGTSFICSASAIAFMTAAQTASVSCTPLSANLTITGATFTSFSGCLLQRTA